MKEMIEMNEIIESYKEYLMIQEQDLDKAIEELSQDHRMDEANHKKIEKNVVDIFTKMFLISVQQAGGDKEKLAENYLDFFEKIPKNWYSNLERCKGNGKEEEAFIEELKIARKDQLKDKFVEMM